MPPGQVSSKPLLEDVATQMLVVAQLPYARQGNLEVELLLEALVKDVERAVTRADVARIIPGRADAGVQ